MYSNHSRKWLIDQEILHTTKLRVCPLKRMPSQNVSSLPNNGPNKNTGAIRGHCTIGVPQFGHTKALLLSYFEGLGGDIFVVDWSCNLFITTIIKVLTWMWLWCSWLKLPSWNFFLGCWLVDVCSFHDYLFLHSGLKADRRRFRSNDEKMSFLFGGSIRPMVQWIME